MKKEMKYFISDLVEIIYGLYEQSLCINNIESFSQEDIDFYFGLIAGYYEIILTIEKLLIELDYEEEIKKGIMPKIKLYANKSK